MKCCYLQLRSCQCATLQVLGLIFESDRYVASSWQPPAGLTVSNDLFDISMTTNTRLVNTVQPV